MKQCPFCSNLTNDSVLYCNHCGYKFPQEISIPSIVSINEFDREYATLNGIKLNVTLLAFFLGWMGAHKFYLKKPIQGVIYLLFCWTFIPGVIAFMEGIRYACLSTEHFSITYNQNRQLC